jgi:hypothetical protein
LRPNSIEAIIFKLRNNTWTRFDYGANSVDRASWDAVPAKFKNDHTLLPP